MTLKALIAARLSHLGITAYRASVQAGKKPSWIANMSDNPKVPTLRKLASVLGLPVKVLMDGGDVTAYPPPEWLTAKRETSADATALASVSLPVCSICGRHRRLVSKGRCMACYQRERRATGRYTSRT